MLTQILIVLLYGYVFWWMPYEKKERKSFLMLFLITSSTVRDVNVVGRPVEQMGPKKSDLVPPDLGESKYYWFTLHFNTQAFALE